MAKYEFDKKKFEEWKAAQNESAAIQEKMNSSLSGYFETMSKIKELQKNIQFIEAKRNQMAQEYGDSAKEVRDNWAKLIEARKRGDAEEIKALQKKDDELRKILAAKKEGLKITEAELKLLKEQTAQLTESAKQASLMSAGLGSAVGFLGKTPGLIKQGFGMLKGTGIFEMDKAILNANKSMAGSEKTFDNLYNSIKGAAKTTTMWGVGVKDLAIMQQGYSEEIGRSVMLTERGFKSMAGMAEGTGLGKEFAVQIAGGMDKFNISAERTSQIVENTMNKAAKIGVNGAAALKSLQNNLKLAQRFNFKGGIAGLAKLSAEATKLRLDMEGIAGMAEKVFRPEGAIEMAAQLTTMGGKFAALGDPMQLMFQARNDPEKFAKNIGKASSEFGEFNEKTGEFELKGGLALDRMREISNITGIAVEKLQEMAEAQARVESVKSKLKGGMFSEEDSDLISSMAKFDKKKGWVINLNGQDKLLKDLRQSDMESIRAEDKTLKDRAEFGRSFDETIQDLILMAKEMLLPLAKSLRENFGERVKELAKWFNSSKFRDMVDGIINGVGTFIKYIGDFMKENPITTAVTAGATLFGGSILKYLGDSIMWLANGVLLGKGFMSVAGGFGGGGGAGFGVPGGQIGPALPKAAKGKFGAFKPGSMGLGLGLGLAGLGMEYGRSQMENPESTGGKLLGIGAKTAEYAAMGSMFGPWGALVGGGLGLGMGIYDEYVTKGTRGEMKSSDSGPKLYKSLDSVMFHENDKFLKVNDAISIAGTSTSGNGKLAQEIANSSSSTPGEMTHKFEDMKIAIDVNIPGNEKLGTQLANTPEFIRRINEAINKEIAMAAGGGKLSGGGPKKSGKK